MGSKIFSGVSVNWKSAITPYISFSLHIQTPKHPRKEICIESYASNILDSFKISETTFSIKWPNSLEILI